MNGPSGAHASRDIGGFGHTRRRCPVRGTGIGIPVCTAKRRLGAVKQTLHPSGPLRFRPTLWRARMPSSPRILRPPGRVARCKNQHGGAPRHPHGPTARHLLMALHRIWIARFQGANPAGASRVTHRPTVATRTFPVSSRACAGRRIRVYSARPRGHGKSTETRHPCGLLVVSTLVDSHPLGHRPICGGLHRSAQPGDHHVGLSHRQSGHD